MRTYAMVQRPSSVFPIKRLISKTTIPISTKLGRTHALGMGIHICSNTGVGTFWGLIRGKKRKILLNLKKTSSQELLHQMGQYLAWIIHRTRRFKGVQIKSLGS